MSHPLVSVIINCFNGDAYLRQAIDSVLAQTYGKWEIVFWDNQSTDSSAAIIKSYDDPRITYHYAPVHTFLYDARNRAIAKARGELLAFLDVDDWWLPEKLARQVVLFQDPDVALACSNYRVRNERKRMECVAFNRPQPSGYVLDNLLRNYTVALLTLMLRRSALPTGELPFDPRYHMIGDFDRVVRLAARWKLARVDDPLAVYRIHDSNESVRRAERQIQELVCWQWEMAITSIGENPNFRWAVARTEYIQGVNAVMGGHREEAWARFAGLPWGILKLRLLAGMVLPRALVKKLK